MNEYKHRWTRMCSRINFMLSQWRNEYTYEWINVHIKIYLNLVIESSVLSCWSYDNHIQSKQISAGFGQTCDQYRLNWIQYAFIGHLVHLPCTVLCVTCSSSLANFKGKLKTSCGLINRWHFSLPHNGRHLASSSQILLWLWNTWNFPLWASGSSLWSTTCQRNKSLQFRKPLRQRSYFSQLWECILLTPTIMFLFLDSTHWECQSSDLSINQYLIHPFIVV